MINIYKISDFLNEFEKPYNIIEINGVTYSIRKINKVQENLILKYFEDFIHDMTLFIPTMYALLKDTNLEILKDKFKDSFGNDIKNIKFQNDKEFIKALEIKAANTIFSYITEESGLITNKVKNIIQNSIEKTISFIDSPDFYQIYPFINVLVEKGYRLIEIKKMNTSEIIRSALEEVVLSNSANTLVYICNILHRTYSIDTDKIFKLFKQFNPNKEDEIQEYLSTYKSSLTINGQDASEDTFKAKKGKMILEDGTEIDLDERDQILNFIGVNGE